MSIKTKLIILFLAIAVIPLAFVSALTFHNYRDSMKAIRLEGLQHVAAFKADKIESYFSGLRKYIEIAQGFYNIKKNLPVLARLARHGADPAFLAAKEELDGQLQGMQSLLNLADIMLVNAEGKIVYASNSDHWERHFLRDLPDDQRKIFEQGSVQVFFSDIFLNKTDGDKPSMLVTAPLFDFKGVFIGGIAFDVDMAPVYELIQDVTGLGGTGETLLGKKAEDELIFLNPLRHEPLAALKKRLSMGGVFGGPMQRAVRGENGAGVLIDYRGEPVIAVWRYLPLLQWGMVAKIDAQEAFADIFRFRNLVIFILFIISVLAGVTAFSIAHSISGPIQKLSKGAEIIGKGNLDHKVGTSLKDEVGQLSRSFDQMTGNLKTVMASRDELNKEISERKHAEEALRVSESFYRQMLESIPGMVFTTRSDGYCDYQSQQWVDYTGVPMAEHLGDGWNKLQHPDDRSRSSAAWKAAVEGRSAYDLEYRVRRYDGVYEWFKVIGRPIRDDSGEIVRWFGVAVNIQGIKDAEKALLESEQRVRKKLDSVLSPEGSIGDLEISDIIDAKSIQVFMDDFYKLSHIPMAIIDLKGKTLVGVGWQDVCTKFHRIHPETCKFCVESDTQLTANFKQGEFKLYKCKNGMWDAATPLVIGGRKFGNLFMGQFFFKDEKIDYEVFRSQAKRYGFDEQEYIVALDAAPRLSKASVDAGMAFLMKIAHMISTLSYSNIELARILSQRDHILRALQMSEERLKRSNENLEQFAYVASHDLQEPLRVMSSYSQLLEKRYKDKLDQDANEFIEFIVDAAKRMQKLIMDLLAYSRLDKKDIVATQEDLNLMVQKVLDGMAATLEASAGTVTCDKLPVLTVHDTSVMQVFQNLIGNALKFRGKASPKVHISAKKDGEEWIFSVRDNGVGIEPQYYERIFQIFQRLHSREEYSGTGIGLSICKKIVTNHGGRIWVESEYGKGSTFYFTLPT